MRQKNALGLDKVNGVCSLIKTVIRFKSVSIIKREKTGGLRLLYIDGVTNIVNQHRKIIVLKDDIVISPYFLKI
jgi:hypothetical protein